MSYPHFETQQVKQGDNVLSEWALNDSLIHLNHAAVGPWPVRTYNAINRFANENVSQGSLNYPQWLKVEHSLKKNLARLINAPDPDSIALSKSTSEALSIIAYGIDFQAGDNIVISNQEFPSNRIVWESLADRGVEVIAVDLNSDHSPEQALMQHCNKKTRLLSISSVQFATGLKLNLQALGDYCHTENILFCVDAIQSVGAEPIDVQACHIDFLAADGHKWMLAPEGLALFYCRSELIDQLKLHQFGWHMVENMGDYDAPQWSPANNARRFECGSPNMLGVHALNASTSLLLEVGLDEVHQLIEKKISRLFEKLNTISHVNIVTPESTQQRLGIFSFYSESFSSEKMFEHLKQHDVFCALRSNCIRFSPHYYTPDGHIEKVIELIKAL